MDSLVSEVSDSEIYTCIKFQQQNLSIVFQYFNKRFPEGSSCILPCASCDSFDILSPMFPIP